MTRRDSCSRHARGLPLPPRRFPSIESITLEKRAVASNPLGAKGPVRAGSWPPARRRQRRPRRAGGEQAWWSASCRLAKDLRAGWPTRDRRDDHVHAHYMPRRLVERLQRDGARYGVSWSRRARLPRAALSRMVWPAPFFAKAASRSRPAPREHGGHRDRSEILSTWTDLHAHALGVEQGVAWHRLSERVARGVALRTVRHISILASGYLPSRGAARELEHAVKQLGAVGAVAGQRGGHEPRELPLRRVWAAAVELAPRFRIPCSRLPRAHPRFAMTHGRAVHGGTTPLRRLADRQRRADRFPQLDLILSHGGGTLPIYQPLRRHVPASDHAPRHRRDVTASRISGHVLRRSCTPPRAPLPWPAASASNGSSSARRLVPAADAIPLASLRPRASAGGRSTGIGEAKPAPAVPPAVIVHLVDGTYELFRYFLSPAAAFRPQALPGAGARCAAVVGSILGCSRAARLISACHRSRHRVVPQRASGRSTRRARG